MNNPAADFDQAHSTIDFSSLILDGRVEWPGERTAIFEMMPDMFAMERSKISRPAVSAPGLGD